MRKFIVFVLGFLMIMTLVACGAKEEKTSGVTGVSEDGVSGATEKNKEKSFAVLEAKDCFYGAGFVELIAGAEESAEYTFAAENSETVEWSVYVLDQAFEDGLRYIKQAAEPVLVGDGTINIEKGQYVYVYCSANEFTADAADEHAKLNITVK
jgi:hypothetical protein